MDISIPMTKHFTNRTKKHIELVNYFAKKVGQAFPNHDMDKFNKDMVNPYTILTWCYFRNMPIPPEHQKDIENICKKHYQSNPHHPEHWSDIKEMDEKSLIEMCADWCAMSKEKHNDPINWADDHIGGKWDFSETQIYFIYKTLNKMWLGE